MSGKCTVQSISVQSTTRSVSSMMARLQRWYGGFGKLAVSLGRYSCIAAKYPPYGGIGSGYGTGHSLSIPPPSAPDIPVLPCCVDVCALSSSSRRDSVPGVLVVVLASLHVYNTYQ